MRLSEGPVFSYLGETFADRAVIWIVDIDVSAWAGTSRLDHLVTLALFLLIKGHLDCLFLQKSTLYIVALLLVDGVLTRTWVAKVGLLCEGRSDVVLPKVAARGRAHEWVDILATTSRCARTTKL